MSNYKRIFLQNHCYFLTVLLGNRKLSLLTDHIGLLKQAFTRAKKEYPFKIYAISILPEHFHMIIYPTNAKDYSLIISSIKRNFSNSLDGKIKQQLKQNLSPSKLRKGESGV